MSDNKDITLETYSHDEASRINNPPVGLVSSQTDKIDGHKKYEHDPYIDPSLSWAGKKEGTSFEVPNVSLHIHERIDPKRLTKSFLKQDLLQPVQPSLFEQPTNEPPLNKAIDFYSHEQDWTNRLIAGDSLLIMNSLLQKEGMAGKVQMIYIDPPYGIKYNSNFQPFTNIVAVKDNNDADIPAEPEMITAYRDAWELGVHSYLSHLRNRILLAKELLNETGSIFVQIGDENVHHIRELMDEIFGAKNFCSLITFRTKSPLRQKLLGNVSDYIIWYSKDVSKVKFRKLLIDKPIGENSRYSWVELPTHERRRLTNDEKQDLSLLPKGSRLFVAENLLSAGSTPTCIFPFEFEGKTYNPGGGRSWKTNKKGMQKLNDLNRLIAPGDSLYWISYVDDFPAMELTSTWYDTQGEPNKIYVVQTSVKPIQRCMLMTTDPGDLILDPTCGSGTSAYTAELWGRRWITCDSSRVAVALAKQRMMTSQLPYFKLAHPNEGVKSGFEYKRIQHITLKAIAQEEISHEEVLYDQPLRDNSKIRVSGPFTVEAVPSLRTKPFNGQETKIEGQGAQLARMGETNKHSQWIDELKSTGIRAINNKVIPFSRIEPMTGTQYIHASGEILEESGENKLAYISFGPDYGPLEQRQVEEVIKEAKALKEKPNFIIFAAFHFDPEAAKDIDQVNNSIGQFIPGTIILKTQMSVDLLTSDLRKKRSSNQSYWLIGQPDTEVIKSKEGTYIVKVNGFDYYNPVSGEIESGSNKRIAMWMLDTNYDERSIFPEQIFFPLEDSKRDWTKLAKALNGKVDEELLEAFIGTESLPFKPGVHQKIAVKIIDDRGIESFVVKNL